VNGLNVGTGMSTFTYVPANGDDVSCIMTSNALCPSGNPATSNTIAMVVVNTNTTATGTVPSPLVLCFDASNTVTVAGEGATFTVQAGGSATMIAGVEISYLDGTTVQAGGYMHGYITLSNLYCGAAGKALPASPGATVEVVDNQPETASGEIRFTVWPNPTKGPLTLACRTGEVQGQILLDVYSMKGELVRTRMFGDRRQHVLDLEGLPAGLYLLYVHTSGHSETIRILLNR
jgi:hypothetical protein